MTEWQNSSRRPTGHLKLSGLTRGRVRPPRHAGPCLCATELVRRFLDYLEYSRAASPHTLRAYKTDLSNFTSYLIRDSNPALADVDRHIVWGFLATLKERGLNTAAIGRTLSALRSFYKFLLRQEIVEANPFTLIRSPHIRHALPVILTEDEMTLLLSMPGKKPLDFTGGPLLPRKDNKARDTKKEAILKSFQNGATRAVACKGVGISVSTFWRWTQKDPEFKKQIEVIRSRVPVVPVEDALFPLRVLRNSAVLEVAYSSACRVSEIVGMDISDIDFSRKAILVTGKGNKQREAILGPYAIKSLRKYLAKRRKDGIGKSSNALFVNLSNRQSGTRLSARNMNWILKGYLRLAGLDPKISIHSIRHSAASHTLNSGANLRQVQIYLSHASIVSTSIYLHLTTAQIQRRFCSTHPRATSENWNDHQASHEEKMKVAVKWTKRMVSSG